MNRLFSTSFIHHYAIKSKRINRLYPFKPDHRNYSSSSLIWNPILFTSGFVLVTFGVLSWQRSTTVWDEKMNSNLNRFSFSKLLDRFRKDIRTPQSAQSSDLSVGEFFQDIKDMFTIHFKNKYSGEKLAIGLIALNTLVFLGWKVPGWYVFMDKHFVHNPKFNRSYTLFTSSISHQSFTHFAFNM